MERIEAEGKILAKLVECMQILQEYEPRSTYLSMTFSDEEHFINVHNEAFRKEIRPINIMSDAPEHKKGVSSVTVTKDPEEIHVDIPDMFTLEELDEAFKKASGDITKGLKKNRKQSDVAAFELVLNLYGAAVKAFLIQIREGES